MNFKNIITLVLATAITTSQTIKAMQDVLTDTRTVEQRYYLHEFIDFFLKAESTNQKQAEIQNELINILIWAEDHDTIIDELTTQNTNGDTVLHLAVKMNIVPLVGILLHYYHYNGLLSILSLENNLHQRPIDVATKYLSNLMKGNKYPDPKFNAKRKRALAVIKLLKNTYRFNLKHPVFGYVSQPTYTTSTPANLDEPDATDDTASTQAICSATPAPYKEAQEDEITDQEMLEFYAKNVKHR